MNPNPEIEQSEQCCNNCRFYDGDFCSLDGHGTGSDEYCEEWATIDSEEICADPRRNY